ncbi:MAG: glycosyltransferase family 2 protein [Patescibacteria group bacterium]|nr:glycosyltransferase family 2 protein [Patescibacteria group bacterium]
MDLSIVILNLNTKELLRDCLQSLCESELPKERFQVIVSDNGSTDGSVEMVRREFLGVEVLENGRNLGFAAGNNAALFKTVGRYVLFLNSDTRVPPPTLPAMVALMEENTNIGAATCLVKTRDERMDVNCHRGFPTPWTALTYFSGLYRFWPRSKLFGGYYQSYKDLDSLHEVDAVEGAFMIVRRRAAELAAISPGKWWDEDFFFFGEDLDFCYRLREKGWKIVYYPGVKIWHYKGATHGFNRQGVVEFPAEERRKLVESTTEAMRLFYKKHYQKKYPGLVTAMVLAGVKILASIRSLKGGI